MTVSRRLGLAAFFAVICLFFASKISLESDFFTLLPSDDPLSHAFESLASFETAQTSLVEVYDPSASPSEIVDEIDRLAAIFEADPLFEVRAQVGLDEGRAIHEAALPYAVDLIPSEVLAERLSTEGLERVFRGQLMRMFGPGGGLFERAFSDDPLDLGGLVTERMSVQEGAWSVQVKRGHLFDRSGTRGVFFLRPKSEVMNSNNAEIVRRIDGILETSPMQVRWFGSHRIAARTEAAVRADVNWAAGLGSFLLLAVFIGTFRSVRPLLGVFAFLVGPALAIAAVTGLASPIHPIGFAFCGALAGLAVDYWLHLYVLALKKSETAPPFEAAQAALIELRTPMALGAGSTFLAFAMLSQSAYPVVAHLGYMGMASVGTAFVSVWVIGPPLFSASVGGSLFFPVLGLTRKKYFLPLIVTLIAAAVVGSRASFDGDPRHLIAVGKELNQLEIELSERYGGFGTGTLVLLQAPSEPALRDQAEAVSRVLNTFAGVSVAGPSVFLPGPAQIEVRRQALPDRVELQARVERAAEAVGFTPESVKGATARLYARPERPLSLQTWTGTPIERLMGAHLSESGETYRAMVQVISVDESQHRAIRRAVLAVVPSANVVVLSQLGAAGMAGILHELLWAGGLSVVLIVFFVWLRYRRLRTVIAVLLPVLGALSVASAAMVLSDTPWNAISVCAMLLILGLGLDYGLFIADQADASHETERAVGISALTTWLGFVGLIFASSPGIRGLGVAVVCGIGSAVVFALFLTGPIVRDELHLSPGVKKWTRRLVLLMGLCFALDLGLQLRFVLSNPPLPEGSHPADFTGVLTGDQRSYGPNRAVRAAGIWTLYLEGDPYERGFAGGKLLSDLIEDLEAETLDQFNTHVPYAIARYGILRVVFLFAAHLDETIELEYLQEIRGYSDGADDAYAYLGPTYTRRVYYHALHDLGQAFSGAPFVEACTGFIAGKGATKDGHWLLGRNFDFDGGAAFDRDKVVQFIHPDEGYDFVSISFASMVGAVSGMNAEGLAVAIQSAGTDDPIRVATPMTLIIREILQTASSLDEVEAILRARRGFVAENVLVVDAQADEAAVFEVSASEVVRLPVDEVRAVANHLISERFIMDPVNIERKASLTTVARQRRMDELVHGQRPLDLLRGAELLSDRRGVGGVPLPPGHRQAINADIASHSVVFDATALTLVVSRYPNQAGGFVRYAFDDVFSGTLEPTALIPARDVQRTLGIHDARLLLRRARRSSGLEALSFTEQALAHMPDHPEALLEHAVALIGVGRDAEAIDPLNRAIQTPLEYPEQDVRARALLETLQ